MMLIAYYRSAPQIFFLCLLSLSVVSCGKDEPVDSGFSLVSLPLEQRRTDLNAILEEAALDTTVSGKFFEITTEIGDVPAACRPEFVAQRWNPGQYQANQFFLLPRNVDTISLLII